MGHDPSRRGAECHSYASTVLPLLRVRRTRFFRPDGPVDGGRMYFCWSAEALTKVDCRVRLITGTRRRAKLAQPAFSTGSLSHSAGEISRLRVADRYWIRAAEEHCANSPVGTGNRVMRRTLELVK